MNALCKLFFLGMYSLCSGSSTNHANSLTIVTRKHLVGVASNSYKVKVKFDDSILTKEARAYRMKQAELLRGLTSIEKARKLVQNNVVEYGRYKSKDTLGIIHLWINEFKAVTNLPDDRVKPIEQAIIDKVGKGHAGGNSVLNSLDMYCLDILLLNMTAIEYGNYSKNVQLIHRWLASKAADKLYMYYKNDSKLSDDQIRDMYKALFK